MGGVDRPDRLLRRAIGRLAQAPLRGGALASPRSGVVPRPAWLAGSGALRADRALPARRRRLRRPARDRSAGPELRPHLHLRHLLARLSLLLGGARGHLPALQPLAGGRPRRRRRLHGDRRAAPGPPRLPGVPRALAGCDRPDRGRLAGGRLRLNRRYRGRPRPRHGRHRRPHLQRLHAGDDGPVRDRGLVRAGGDLLRLLRHVLPARLVRGEGRAARPPPSLLGRHPLGDDPRIGRRRDRLDRDDQLRRRLRGRLQERDPEHLRMASSTAASACSPPCG